MTSSILRLLHHHHRLRRHIHLHYQQQFLESALSVSTIRYYHQSPFITDPTCLSALLTTATRTLNISHATQIHAQIVVNRYATSPSILTNLITFYAKCGYMDKSIFLFSRTDDKLKTVVTWTSLITQFSHRNMPFEALSAFNQMRSNGIYPNEFTFSAVLPACAAAVLAPFHGTQIHGLVSKHGFHVDLFVGSALVDMYAKCFDMASAGKVFDEMPQRNLVTWNAMIVGHVENEVYHEALSFFKAVLGEPSLSPDEVTYSSALGACAYMADGLDTGKQVHGIVLKHGTICLAYVVNSLMVMYCKCRSFTDVINVFGMIEDRDVVSWNVMIMGCVESEKYEEACKYFKALRSQGIFPDEASFCTVLSACSSLAALNQSTLIHSEVIKTGFMTSRSVSDALINMYGKCGCLVDAHRVFEEVKDRNAVTWTAMIAAFQQHCRSDKVIEYFERMLLEGISPNYITLVCVLSACAHSGRVKECYSYFNSMAMIHGINPGHEHYACMVDMLGRAGRLEEAKEFMHTMPIEPEPSIWGALLGACRNHGNLEMGREAAERLFELEPSNSGNYVILANMYACRGKRNEADKLRRHMELNGVRKDPSCSWIDFKGTTYVFTVNDKSHSRSDEIYQMLWKLKELVKSKGYKAETQYAMNDAEDYKESSLWHHSERLALAFALLALPPGAPVRIMKNVRTCGDCHTVMKFTSEIFGREIILRDLNMFHHFANGSCSCGDYW